MTRALDTTDADSENIKTFERLRTKLYLTLIGPLLICFLFVDELAYNMLSNYLTITNWQLIRILPIIIYSYLRYSLFCEEIQF
jgi:hypothetical protein